MSKFRTLRRAPVKPNQHQLGFMFDDAQEAVAEAVTIVVDHNRSDTPFDMGEVRQPPMIEQHTTLVSVTSVTADGITTEYAAAEVSQRNRDEMWAEIAETVEAAETPADDEYEVVSFGSSRKRLQANLDAIKLIKLLNAEGRQATREEKTKLAQYTSFGAISKVFKSHHEDYELVRSVIDDPAWYKEAKASVVNSFYTHPTLVLPIWDFLASLGFTGGHILEPAIGIGDWIGAMPAAMRERSTIHGIDLDTIPATIARYLHPDVVVQNCAFQKANVEGGYYDVVLSNVPFGNYPVYDPEVPSAVSGSIHNYYLVKMMKMTRPGGFFGGLTSRYTMDSAGNAHRELLARGAELVVATRLPSSSHEAYAGCKVVTDLLIWRKRETPLVGELPEWVHADRVEMEGPRGTEHFSVNRHFLQNPGMVLGEPRAVTGHKAPTYTIVMEGGARQVEERLPDILDQKLIEIAGITKATYTHMVRSVSLDRARIFGKGEEGRGLGEYFIGTDGVLYQKMRSGAAPVTKRGADRIRDMIRIAQAATEVVRLNKDGSDDELAAGQAILNEEYSSFLKKWKCPLNRAFNRSCFRDDPRSALLFALEEKVTIKGQELSKDEDKQADEVTWAKRAIFTKRVVNRIAVPTVAENALDALNISMAHHGRLDWPLIVKLCARSEEATQNELEGSAIFWDPAIKEWVLKSEYLSGNVRTKLDQAKVYGNPINIAALEAIQPAWLTHNLIHVAPSASWLPKGVLSRFMFEAMEKDSKLNGGYMSDEDINRKMQMYGGHFVPEPVYIRAANKWLIHRDSQCKHGTLATSAWGTVDYPFVNLMLAILSGSKIEVTRTDSSGKTTVIPDRTTVANDKAREVRAKFQEWLWSNPDRAKECERIYNYRFNATVTPVYDGSMLQFPGMNPSISLRPHQKDAVMRAMQGGNILLWHLVGSGKTLSMQAIAMELLRIQKRQKAMIVVPNHLLMQAASEFQWAYPGAKLLIIDGEMMTPAKRMETLARVATDRWDAVVCTFSTFRNVPLDTDTLEEFAKRQREEIDEMLTALGKGRDRSEERTIKVLETARNRMEAKHEKRMATALRLQQNGGIFWKDLGIDLVIIDECHNVVANLGYNTNMGHVAGVIAQESATAFDAYMKCQSITRLCQNGHTLPEYSTQCACGAGRKDAGQLVFASGTPIKNSIGQLFAVQRFLQLDALIEADIAMFDQWAAAFATTIDNVEMDVSGQWRIKERFARFHNVADLMLMFSQVNDPRMDRSALKLDTPKILGGEPQAIEAIASQWLRDYMKECGERLEAAKKNRDKFDNPLRIYGNALAAAVDPRLIDPSLPMEPEGKIAKLLENILRIYRQYAGKAQAVFLDIGTPQPEVDLGTRIENLYEERITEFLELKDGNRTYAELEPEELAELRSMFHAEVEIAAQESEFNLYADIKLQLINGGIPAHEIAFVHDAKTPTQKRDLFEKVNSAEIRVILGSTAKMGTGTNMQRNLVAIHQVDAPWTPDKIEQRDGRAQRQGNTCPIIEILYYVTSGSLDVHRWNLLKLKMGFINQLAHGNVGRSVEEIDEGGEATASQMLAIASGDQSQIELMKIEKEIRRMQSLRDAHYRKTKDILSNRKNVARYIDTHRERIVKLNETLALINGTEIAGVTVDNVFYDNDDEAVRALATAMMDLDKKEVGECIIEWGPYVAKMRVYGGKHPFQANVKVGTEVIGIDLGKAPRKNMEKLFDVRANVEDLRSYNVRQLDKQERELEALNAAETGGDWPRQAEFDALWDQYRGIEKAVEAKKAEAKKAETEKAPA